MSQAYQAAGKRVRNQKAQLPKQTKVASKRKVKSKVSKPEWMLAEEEAAEDLAAALRIKKQIKLSGRDVKDMPSYDWSEEQPVSDIPSLEGQLLEASENGESKQVSNLLKKGVDPNTKDSARGYSALVWGAMSGETAVVKALVKAKADVNQATPV